MTFLNFLAVVLFLYVADEQNHSQLHFGKKCFQNENGDIIFSHIWVTRPFDELPANKEQCTLPEEPEPPVIPKYGK
jgi:hypothetical protein